METVEQNCRFTLFSSKFLSNLYSILFGVNKKLIFVKKGEKKARKDVIIMLHKILPLNVFRKLKDDDILPPEAGSSDYKTWIQNILKS